MIFFLYDSAIKWHRLAFVYFSCNILEVYFKLTLDQREAAHFMAVLHLEFQLVNTRPVCTCEGANTEVHSRLHRSWDSEDGVKRTDWAGFFPAAGGAAPRGPVAYNMLVPRRETGTDWKHKPGHPDQSHPRGRRAASLFHDRGGGRTLELHIIRSQHICILIHRSWWQKTFFAQDWDKVKANTAPQSFTGLGSPPEACSLLRVQRDAADGSSCRDSGLAGGWHYKAAKHTPDPTQTKERATCAETGWEDSVFFGEKTSWRFLSPETTTPPALGVVGPRSRAGCWLFNKQHWHIKYL